jgi:hypothetical protein
MMTRRDVMAGSLLGTLATSTTGSTDAEQPDLPGVERALKDIKDQLEQIKSLVDTSVKQVSLAQGLVIPVRRALEQFLRVNTKFPDYVEVGTGVFMDLYDWHVKYQQPLQMSRTNDNRLVLRFMVTQVILRPELDAAFVGPPYDRQ